MLPAKQCDNADALHTPDKCQQDILVTFNLQALYKELFKWLLGSTTFLVPSAKLEGCGRPSRL